MATLAEFKARIPGLTGSDEFLQLVLNDAIADVNPSVFGSQTDRAIYLLAAHYAVGQASGQAAQGVSSVTAGSASIVYDSSVRVLSGRLSSTVYGEQYLRLARQFIGMRVVL